MRQCEKSPAVKCHDRMSYSSFLLKEETMRNSEKLNFVPQKQDINRKLNLSTSVSLTQRPVKTMSLYFQWENICEIRTYLRYVTAPHSGITDFTLLQMLNKVPVNHNTFTCSPNTVYPDSSLLLWLNHWCGILHFPPNFHRSNVSKLII